MKKVIEIITDFFIESVESLPGASNYIRKPQDWLRNSAWNQICDSFGIERPYLSLNRTDAEFVSPPEIRRVISCWLAVEVFGTLESNYSDKALLAFAHLVEIEIRCRYTK